ncbi:MAG: hypothetical protein U0O16_01135 [Holdemanella sp.]
MFTTKHFIWIGICILFILIMNHYAKKEDFTLQNKMDPVKRTQ